MDEMISNCCKVFQRLSLSDGEMEMEHALHESECLVDKTNLVDKNNVKQTQLHIVKARPVSQVSANDKDGDSNKDEDNDKGKDINKTATKTATTTKTRTTTKTNTVMKISCTWSCS